MSDLSVLAAWGGQGTGALLRTVHVVAAVAAFGPVLAYPALLGVAGEGGGASAARTAAKLHLRVVLPALLVSILAGIALVSQTGRSFGEPWISASFTIVLLLFVVSWFVLLPALRRLEQSVGTDSPADAKRARAGVGAASGAFHLGLVVLVALMFWRPGG